MSHLSRKKGKCVCAMEIDLFDMLVPDNRFTMWFGSVTQITRKVTLLLFWCFPFLWFSFFENKSNEYCHDPKMSIASFFFLSVKTVSKTSQRAASSRCLLISSLENTCNMHRCRIFCLILDCTKTSASASAAENSTIFVPTQIPFDLSLCGCLFGCSEWACCM